MNKKSSMIQANILRTYINKDKRRDEGLTLIALIVTIIVLLVLAGVSIGMLARG